METKKNKKEKSWVQRIGEKIDSKAALLMLIPAIIAIAVVSLYPSIRTIIMSFFDRNLFTKEEPFVGLDNYIKALSDPGVWQTIFNTLFFSIVSLIFAIALAMFVAMKLIKSLPGQSFFRALFLVPWVTPPLVASLVWRFIFSENFSPINSILLNLGIIEAPINFLGSTEVYFGFLSVPLIMLTIINVWSIFPFLMVMFIAGLQTVPEDLYDAAKIDGAGSFVRFWRITVPEIMPVISVSIVLELIWQFNNFNISYMVTNGGPLGLTKTLSVEVYQQAFSNYKYGYAAAISVIMMLIMLIPSVIYIRSTLKDNQ